MEGVDPSFAALAQAELDRIARELKTKQEQQSGRPTVSSRMPDNLYASPKRKSRRISSDEYLIDVAWR
jgi:hypothetical protein